MDHAPKITRTEDDRYKAACHGCRWHAHATFATEGDAMSAWEDAGQAIGPPSHRKDRPPRTP